MHKRIPQKFLPLLGLFWAVTAALYALAWRSGFERDFHGWLELFYYRSFSDAMMRSGARITSLYQVTQMQLWLWTALFGTAKIPWFLLMTGLHAAATALAVRFFARLLEDFKAPRAAATLGGFLFLVMPSGAEVVVWKASYHYPVAILLCFGVLLSVQRALRSPGAQGGLGAAVMLYAVSTFTLELFYTTLPLAVLLALQYRRAGLAGAPAARRVALRALLPMAGLFLLHFVVYRLVYNGGIPHAQGLLQESLQHPAGIGGRALGDEAHLLLQARYWPHAARDALYRFAEHPATGWGVNFLLLALGAFCGWRLLTGRRSSGAAVWTASAALLGLVLILHYPVSTLGIYYNDRWLYFTALAQWQLVAVVLLGLRPHLRAAAVGILLLALFGCTAFTVVQCRRAARVFWAALEGYRWKDERRPVVILNMPSNLDFIPIVLATSDFDEFNSHLQIFTGDSAHGRIQTVAGYNLVKWWDGVHVDRTGPGAVRVVFNQSGTWWWNGTMGASAHETDLYRMQLGADGLMDVTLKDSAVRMIYFNGGKWRDASRNAVK